MVAVVLALAVATPTVTHTPYEQCRATAKTVNAILHEELTIQAVKRHSVATLTPNAEAWLGMSRAEIYNRGVARGAFEAIANPPPGVWLITATMTKSPTPNAEATCVAVGHDWEVFERTGDPMHLGMAEISFECSHLHCNTPGECNQKCLNKWPWLQGWHWGIGMASCDIARCRRCHLWREKP
jgi:hypothetical protein